MPIRAVVFDIGGVLETTPRPTVAIMMESWEERLGLPAGAIGARLADVWEAGGVGACTEDDVRAALRTRLGMDQTQVDAFMDDLWIEYLGELNVELTTYFANLRPRYQTALLSNSFVGARQREQDRYQFGDITDLIVYSHEVGIAKPDPRIYALTCERLGIQPAEMLFVDDYAPNIAAARAFGAQAILYQTTEQTIAEIEAALRAAPAS